MYAVLGLFLSNLLATDLIFQFYLVTPKKLSLSVVLNYWYSAEQKTNDIITHYPSFFFRLFYSSLINYPSKTWLCDPQRMWRVRWFTKKSY